MIELNISTLKSSTLVNQIFDFWFKGRGHIRSPFPKDIQQEVREKSIERFQKWISGLTDAASKEINDTVVGDTFEEIIFETALRLVTKEDQKITINYPFMPRVGDEIKKDLGRGEEKSLIVDRSIAKEEDQTYLLVTLESQSSGEKWKTRFELPA